MLRMLMTLFLFALVQTKLSADTVRISTSDADYQITNFFGDVDLFRIDIDIDIPLTPGLYIDPTIISVSYRVFGALEPGTPSGFPSFDLIRDIDGTEFYEQGSSLMFEIAADADFTDGIQADELINNGTILTINAREIDNGRFHPAIFELYADGSGRIQNSNNIHTTDPLLVVNFGDEYITDLSFDVSNTTLMTVVIEEELPIPTERMAAGSISGLMSLFILLLLVSRKRVMVQNLSTKTP